MGIAEEVFCPNCGWKPATHYKYQGHQYDTPPQKCATCGATLKKKLVIRNP